jgi:hypothetical protein
MARTPRENVRNGGYQRTSARTVAGQNTPSDQGNQGNGLHYNGKRGDLSEKRGRQNINVPIEAKKKGQDR